jgi:glycosyltransferase involved in cell wall biosynthesis
MSERVFPHRFAFAVLELQGVVKQWAQSNLMSGRGEGASDLNEAERAVLEARLPPVYIITQRLPRQHMARLLRSMTAFVLPTRGEGFGLPIVSACV